MNNLFLALDLLSVLGLIVGLVNPKIMKFKSRKSAAGIFSAGIIVFFILFGITSGSNSSHPSSSEVAAIATNSTAPTVQPTASGSSTAAPLTTSTIEPTSLMPKGYKLTALDAEIRGEVNSTIAYETTASWSYAYPALQDVFVTGTLAVVELTTGDQPLDQNTREVISRLNGQAQDLLRDGSSEITSAISQRLFNAHPSIGAIFVIFWQKDLNNPSAPSTGWNMRFSMDRIAYAAIDWSNFKRISLCDFLANDHANDPAVNCEEAGQ